MTGKASAASGWRVSYLIGDLLLAATQNERGWAGGVIRGERGVFRGFGLRGARPPCGTSAGCARDAGNCCCSPTARQTPPASGRPGTRPSARR
jgi:hypothetical protein